MWLESNVLDKEPEDEAGQSRKGRYCVDVRTPKPVESFYDTLFEPNRGYACLQGRSPRTEKNTSESNSLQFLLCV